MVGRRYFCGSRSRISRCTTMLCSSYSDSPHKGASVLADVAAWGRAGLDSDAGGYRTEFISLVGRAQAVLQ